MSSLSVESAQDNQAGTSGEAEVPSKKRVKWIQLLVYMLCTAIGAIGGPLLQRLYYLHGGSRKWLSSCLQTLGFPIILLPLSFLFYKHKAEPNYQDKPSFFMGPKLLTSGAALGLLVGLDNYMYSMGLAYIPVSTSSLLFSTQLAFTAIFAFIIVRQKFSFCILNSVVVMTMGAVVLALRMNGDRPPGVSKGEYLLGFFLTLGGAILIGFILPCIELAYRKSGNAVSLAIAMQFQLIFTLTGSVFCLIGMAINKDYRAIPREAKLFGLGQAKYYVVIVSSAIVWQFLFVGALGVVYCTSSLFAGILNAFLLPLTPVAAVIAFDEKFTGEKGLSLALCLWGFTSYFVGQYTSSKKVKAANETQENAPDV